MDHHIIKKEEDKVDKDIVQSLYQVGLESHPQMNLSLEGKSKDDVLKAIREKRNLEFCAVYELLLHDKVKQLMDTEGNSKRFNFHSARSPADKTLFAED